MAHVCLHSESGYILGFRRKIAHNGSHGETRGVSDGGGITTLGPFRTFTNIPGPGIRTAYFASFGAWSGMLPKNAGSLGTAMRLCVSLFRGVAAPLGCVIFFQFCRNCDLYAMRACARHGRYHYPQRALRAAETPDGRLSKRLICRFLRSGGHHWFQRCKMCPAFYKNSSSSRQTAPVPCERDRSCFFVTSWSVPGTRRSVRGCRWSWGRNDHCPRRQ